MYLLRKGNQLFLINQKDLVMHVSLPITGGHRLMGTDAPEEMGFSLTFGTNCFINLEPAYYSYNAYEQGFYHLITCLPCDVNLRPSADHSI